MECDQRIRLLKSFGSLLKTTRLAIKSNGTILLAGSFWVAKMRLIPNFRYSWMMACIFVFASWLILSFSISNIFWNSSMMINRRGTTKSGFFCLSSTIFVTPFSRQRFIRRLPSSKTSRRILKPNSRSASGAITRA